MQNRLVIGGRIAKVEAIRYSPAGLPITRLVLDHGSTQHEAGHDREARCRLPCLLCGSELHRQLDQLNVGTVVQVEGFLSRSDNRHGSMRLVLHTEQITIVETLEG